MTAWKWLNVTVILASLAITIPYTVAGTLLFLAGGFSIGVRMITMDMRKDRNG